MYIYNSATPELGTEDQLLINKCSNLKNEFSLLSKNQLFSSSTFKSRYFKGHKYK